MGSPTPSQEELRDLSLACQRVWSLDENRLEPGRDYQVDLQVGKKGWEQADVAAGPLFVSVQPAALQGRRTYAAFTALLDNYERETGRAERTTQQEAGEEHAFLEAVTASRPMQYVHQYLAAKNLVAGQLEDFRRQLHQMWFSPYSRSSVRDDTCGFEHVFVGEVDDGKVVGLHNWIQFYLLERAGQVNYLGHLLPRGRQGQEHAELDGGGERLISLQFAWRTERKDVSSIWLGTSPEFELALYTLCFVAGAEENLVTLAGYEVKIRSYHIHSKYGDKVGSCFPELLSKQPGFHQPAPSAPPAQPWQQGTPATQHQGWALPPAQQYHHQQQQQQENLALHAHQQPGYYGNQGQPYQQQQQGPAQAWQQQGEWQPAGYQPQGFAQPQPPQNQGAQQGCASFMPMIVRGVKQLMRNRQLMAFLRRKFYQWKG